MVRTLASHAGNRSSTLRGTTNLKELGNSWLLFFIAGFLERVRLSQNAQMQGARGSISAAYSRVREHARAEAQRRRWAFVKPSAFSGKVDI